MLPHCVLERLVTCLILLAVVVVVGSIFGIEQCVQGLLSPCRTVRNRSWKRNGKHTAQHSTRVGVVLLGWSSAQAPPNFMSELWYICAVGCRYIGATEKQSCKAERLLGRTWYHYPLPRQDLSRSSGGYQVWGVVGWFGQFGEFWHIECFSDRPDPRYLILSPPGYKLTPRLLGLPLLDDLFGARGSVIIYLHFCVHAMIVHPPVDDRIVCASLY